WVVKEYEKMVAERPDESHWSKSLAEAKEQFAKGDFTAVCRRWFGGEIDEEGNLYYTSNPNAKWDWYSLGGRWQGLFSLKADGSKVDQANKGEIDFDKSRFADYPDRPWHEWIHSILLDGDWIE